MRRSRLLKVIDSKDYPRRANEISKRASKKRRERASRYSPEVTRDSEIEVEPLPFIASDGPACDVEAYQRYVRRRTVRALVGTAPEPVPTPRTRADCPPERQHVGCGAYKCRYHLARVDEPPGRPGLANVPRDERTGWTISIGGDMGPRPPMGLDPLWLRGGRMPQTCALDVADAGANTNESLGEVLGKHRTMIARLVKRAVGSLAEHGVTYDELTRLLPNHEPDPDDGITRRRGS